MLPLFFIYILWGIWALIWSIAVIWPAYSVRKLKLWEDALYRLICLGAAALLLTVTPWPGLDVQYSLWDRMPEGPMAWRIVTIATAGIAIAIWAQIERLRALQNGPKLVTTGPYRLLRQPLYTALAIAIAATALLFGRPSSFLGAILLAGAFFAKALLEERRSSGPEFAAYRQRTMAVVPVIGLVVFEIRRFFERSRLWERFRGFTVKKTASPRQSEAVRPVPASLRITTVPVVLVLNEEPESRAP